MALKRCSPSYRAVSVSRFFARAFCMDGLPPGALALRTSPGLFSLGWKMQPSISRSSASRLSCSRWARAASCSFARASWNDMPWRRRLAIACDLRFSLGW